jgi:hypothetical protein
MLVYVSGPYTGDIDANIERAAQVAAELWEMGHVVICPHTNTAHFEERCNATYEHYLKGDLVILSVCDVVVMLEGWQESRGAVAERNHAVEWGIPVYYYPDVPPLHPVEKRCPKQAENFRIILGKLYRLHLKKNADYSPANILVTGEVGLITRLWDKIARLLSLYGFRFEVPKPGRFEGTKKPNCEGILDTYQDAAVYSIIGMLLLDGVWGK